MKFEIFFSYISEFDVIRLVFKNQIFACPPVGSLCRGTSIQDARISQYVLRKPCENVLNGGTYIVYTINVITPKINF